METEPEKPPPEPLTEKAQFDPSPWAMILLSVLVATFSVGSLAIVFRCMVWYMDACEKDRGLLKALQDLVPVLIALVIARRPR